MVLYVDLDSLPASTLRHLAALREERERARDTLATSTTRPWPRNWR